MSINRISSGKWLVQVRDRNGVWFPSKTFSVKRDTKTITKHHKMLYQTQLKDNLELSQANANLRRRIQELSPPAAEKKRVSHPEALRLSFPCRAPESIW